jgi:hypothetical protein
LSVLPPKRIGLPAMLYGVETDQQAREELGPGERDASPIAAESQAGQISAAL